MAFQETELHKLHLRLAAIEKLAAVKLSSHLHPHQAVFQSSEVKEPAPEKVADPIPADAEPDSDPQLGDAEKEEAQ